MDEAGGRVQDGPSGRLRDRVAIVTGGSSGIGRATCLALACEGARVVVVGRDLGRLAETAGSLGAAGDALALALDVRSEADMRQMADRTLERFGRIDVLVAAAGIPRPLGSPLKAALETPAADWDAVLDTNLRGTFLSNRAVLPEMIRREGGDIVNLSSIAGRRGLAFDGPYAASKFAIIGLSEALAEEVGPLGVRVQVVLPGPFGTEAAGKQGSLPHSRQHPPAARVADLIVQIVSMPDDVRLSTPTIEPLVMAAGSGWRAGRGLTSHRG